MLTIQNLKQQLKEVELEISARPGLTRLIELILVRNILQSEIIKLLESQIETGKVA